MVQVTWYGHSTFKIEGSKTVFVDPFFDDNPASPVKVADIEKADVIYVTHDHFDHIVDAAPLAKKTGATLVATYEIATSLAEEHGIKTEPANLGGSIHVDGVICHLVPAWHTTGLGGTPSGVVIEIDGKKIYHMGDTCLFGDMGLIGALFRPDLLLIPIGDRFTMGPRSASKAVGMVQPRFAIPMHYNTWPPIEQDPRRFAGLVQDECPTSKVAILDPGETFTLA